MIAALPVTAQQTNDVTACISSNIVAAWRMQFELGLPPLRRSLAVRDAAGMLRTVAEPELTLAYVKPLWTDDLPSAASFPAGQEAWSVLDMAPAGMPMMGITHASNGWSG